MTRRPKGMPRATWFHASRTDRREGLWRLALVAEYQWITINGAPA